MAFIATQDMFSNVDTILNGYVAGMSTRVIATATPFITVMLTITFIFYGLLIMRGAIQMPMLDFLGRSIRIGLIASIALAGGLYQSSWAGIIVDLPDAMATALLTNPDPGQDHTAGSSIDRALGSGLTKANELWSSVSILSPGASLLFVMAGVAVMIFTVLLGGIGVAILMVCKVATALIAALGPIFIMALMFKSTAQFFNRWVAQLLNYTILMVLFVAVFGLIIQMYGTYVAGLSFNDGASNMAWSLGGLGLTCLAGLFLLMQLPGIASGLAGGVAVSFVAPVMTAMGLGVAAARAAPLAARMLRR